MPNVINADNGVSSGSAGLKSSSDGTGILALQTNGTTAVTVDASQNVGIGTTTPANGKLVITGSAVTTAQGIRLTGDTADARFICESATLGAGILGTFSNHSQLFYTNSTEQARIDSNGLFKFNSGYGSVATAYGCRAWVNFNGTGTVAIRASANVTSITDNGVGDYTVNLTNAMPDANYSICGAVGNTTSSDKLIIPTNLSAPTTSAFRIGSQTTAGVYNDNNYVWAAIFR